MTDRPGMFPELEATKNPPPPLIINAALTGIVSGKADSRYLPVTVDEIVSDAIRCLDAGATVIHVHARDSRGNPSSDPVIYGEIVGRVREARSEAILCATTTGRGGADASQRAAVLDLIGEEKPDMASLTLGSVDFPDASCMNPVADVRELAIKMLARSIKPELEIFHSGMLNTARMLIAKNVLEEPIHCNFIMGSPHMAQGSLAEMSHLVSLLPSGANWAAGGVGQFQYRVNMLALTLGGHVRVGLEDNLWLDQDRTRLATNLELVERVVKMAGEMNRVVATPSQARQILGLT